MRYSHHSFSVSIFHISSQLGLDDRGCSVISDWTTPSDSNLLSISSLVVCFDFTIGMSLILAIRPGNTVLVQLSSPSEKADDNCY
jgi:hypothetical protein